MTLADEQRSLAVDAQAAAAMQGDTSDVENAIQELKKLKAEADAAQKAYESSAGDSAEQSKEAFRAQVTGVLERRLFYMPSFKIYGSVAGFYDYGPPGCAVKQYITQYWRQHFVLEEDMLQVECPAVTPEVVLKASGHVERFTDFMVTDAKTGDCHRADHLLKGHLKALLEDKKTALPSDKAQEVNHLLASVDELSAKQLGDALTAYDVKSPDTKNDISAPFPFNLMFKTSIGPKGDQVGYLRPETAQGLFVNFRDLLYYNGGKLPFAAAQIGQSYRNEISPRAGLIRVREFTQAEIEHFCHPKHKMGADKQAQPMKLGQAVQQGIIGSQTLAYFIGRTYLYMKKIGMDHKRLRFRQHLQNEMAHYASDCWDAEAECSYGWIECAGLSDRSAFDLKAHAAKSKQDMTAFEKYDEPQLKVTVKANKQALGKTFKRQAQSIQDALEQMQGDECAEQDALRLKQQLDKDQSATVEVDGEQVTIKPNMVEIKQEMKSGGSFTPSVIEPSFGIGRIMYCMFEHTFWQREAAEKKDNQKAKPVKGKSEEDARRSVFSFTPLVAPIKATVFPLLQKHELNGPAQQISADLRRAAVANVVDTTGVSIGRRYARTDEIGVPFAVTVDYETLEKQTVTVRERDTTAQVRVPVAEVVTVLKQLADMEMTWQQIESKYPAQAAAEADNA
ncbi:MAG: glycyl-tRNA synthetase [Trebouxia sp. A1-2]|nr:MAG: glycyl-tRNA synthetase [Trebouxia sp. A1-2]